LTRFPWKTLAGALLVIGWFVAWWQLGFPTASYRYRLTVAVETDGKVHAGSSVIELFFRFNPKWLGPSGGTYNVWVTGQAALIDLGARGALVAALANYPPDPSVVNASLLPSCAFLPAAWKDPADSLTTAKNQWTISQFRKGPVDLGPGCMPAFYWFANPADLAGVKEVKPKDFAAVIGDAARLVSARVEITRDPLDIDIDKKLPAYATLIAPPTKGIYTTPGGLILGSGQFISKGNE
jgi:hypothetical protein